MTLKKLEEFGITLKNLVEAGMALYIGSEEEEKEVKKNLEKIILKQLSNPNVSTLIIAAILLDREGKNGKLPFNYSDDPNYVYADEVIGLAIANEIAGTKAIFNFRFYDGKKPGIIGKLDKEGYMFLDDAIAGLLAGCMSKVFEV
ncbi:alpha-ribazole phosphatase CobZ [Methanocaldococcus vulcanius M7]|uniref:Alpha-ribazole phosphatase CobZ n=1 Tax=Methanocaldococcus vulcanius (strain ATCC 700851 / DSM 12094 / M7) TaxID=579137 RepID=C9RGM4_METVM|nr:alpha-ribazole phosphatase CobZ [Methanocaldococcus vulcanius]ACX72726.1 alpha-ribazole phosphatase CobZ [Methanocaldococcus vulcanius M7]